MAVLAGVANFAVIEPTLADPTRAADAAFRPAIAALVIVAILDVIVAAALTRVFASRALTSAMAWFRVSYAAVFLVAISQLMIAATSADPTPALHAFEVIWNVSLILFGVHLLLLGWLAITSGFVPRVFGILLAIAGFGYLFDGFATVLIAQPAFALGQVTFIGEVALMFWLLIAGGRSKRPTSV